MNGPIAAVLMGTCWILGMTLWLSEGGEWSFLLFVVLPFVLFVLAVYRGQLDKARQSRTSCPFCAEIISRAATLCPHCRSDLKEPTAAPPPAAKPEPPMPQRVYQFEPEMPDSPFRRAGRGRGGRRTDDRPAP